MEKLEKIAEVAADLEKLLMENDGILRLGYDKYVERRPKIEVQLNLSEFKKWFPDFVRKPMETVSNWYTLEKKLNGILFFTLEERHEDEFTY